MHHWQLLQVVKFLDSHASACRTLCQLFASVCSRSETLGGDSEGVGRKAGIYGALDRSIKAVD
jgi:hypothetical protein